LKVASFHPRPRLGALAAGQGFAQGVFKNPGQGPPRVSSKLFHLGEEGIVQANGHPHAIKTYQACTKMSIG